MIQLILILNNYCFDKGVIFASTISYKGRKAFGLYFFFYGRYANFFKSFSYFFDSLIYLGESMCSH